MLAALCGVVSGAMGYIAGGAIFRTTWKMVSRDMFRELEWVCVTFDPLNISFYYLVCKLQRDEDFLKRLQKPRFSEVNKYDDDYYGDKILTLSDYRQWIRQQQKRKDSIEALNTAGKGSDETQPTPS